MLDEICPVQFIEGINENEVPTDDRFLEFRDYGMAIPYTPGVTYCLTRIEIYGSAADLDKPKEHKVAVYTDHNDNPSKTSLTSGKLTVPSGNGEQWLGIELAQPIVLLAQQKYWLTIPESPLMFAVGIAKDGKRLSIRANPSGSWASSQSGRMWKCMLRFYGRVLPIASLPMPSGQG